MGSAEPPDTEQFDGRRHIISFPTPFAAKAVQVATIDDRHGPTRAKALHAEKGGDV